MGVISTRIHYRNRLTILNQLHWKSKLI